ncbi:zinc finger protein Xfin-like isoform X2 [Pithys albifrons albifrons]|uniref:zinc finger protein Xfin-like isoform X2 n=1 Tax=Pithys albifrons albifrons TaxID=3385563 RepID=UPI003A5CF470
MLAGKEEISEPDGDSGKGPGPGPGASAAPAGEPEVFEIVLPITVIVLSDEDFLQDDAEEQEVSMPEVKQEVTMPEVEQKFSVPEVVEEMTVPEVVQEVTVPEVVEEVSMPEVVQEVAVPEVVQEVTLPEVVQEVTLPKVEQEVTVPELKQEVTLPEVVQEMTVPKVVQEVTLPEVVQEVTVPEVVQEVTVPEVVQEVTVPEVVQEVTVPEVEQKFSVPEVVQEVTVPEVVEEVTVPEVVQEVTVPEVVQEVTVPEVVQEVTVPEVVQEVTVPEVVLEVTVLEVTVQEVTVQEVTVPKVKQEVAVQEVVQEVTVPKVKQEVAVQEVVQEVTVPEVVQEVTVPEVVQEVAVQEVVQEVTVPEVVQEVTVPEVVQEVTVQEVVQEVTVPEVVQEVTVPEVIQEVTVPEVVQEVTVQEVTVPKVKQEVAVQEVTVPKVEQEVTEQEVAVPKVEPEYKLNIVCLKSEVAPSNDSSGVSSWEENNTVSRKDGSVTYSEENWLAEGVCHTSESSLNDGCDAGVDKCAHNCILPMSSCKTQLAEINKTSGGKECDGGFQENPPLLSSAGSEVRDDTRPMTLAAVPKDEELVSVASVLCDGSPEEGPEIHEAVAEMEEPDSSKSGATEADKRKPSKFEDDTLNSLLDHGLKEEQKSTSNCSQPFLNGCSPTFEGLLKDMGKPEVNVSTSAESDNTGEHVYKTLTPFSRKRYRQQKVVSSHANQKEFQAQQEGLVSLSYNVTLSPLSKTSYSTKKPERLNFKCRFCSSVYECSAHLKKHIHSAHKGKKIHKYCFCKRSFFYSFNLKNRLKFHKRITMLQKARKSKNRINARKGRQRGSEGGKSETKKRELKYEKFFIKIERDITPLGVPVSFSCRICSFVSSNPRSFIHHMKAHKERPPYQCPQCEYSCNTFSWLLTHMYWHAGYNLYQCRFCTFFSLYFAGMVRHSSIHTRAKPYSCEFCQLAFTRISELKRHRRLHAGTGMCQGQQPDRVSRRKRTRRPSKNYACDECNLVFSTEGHLTFHKKFHEQLQAGGYRGQSNKYGKICKAEGDSQDCVSLFGRENDCLSGGMLPSEVDCEQVVDVQDNEKMLSVKKFPENRHGSNSLSVLGSRSEVPQTSYHMDTVMYQEELLLKSEPSHSQVQNDDAYHNIVENSKDPCPSNLGTFKTYRCKHCSYATDVDNNLRLHLKIHTAERPFVCKDCNETFKTSNHLQKHSILHVKNGQQELGSCLYIERCLDNLQLHREMHGGKFPERGFDSSEGSDSCLVGSEVFGVQPDVQRGRENDLSAQSQPPFYQCAECKYTTCILSNLELHIRTHTGERPYSCTVCQMKFRTSSHLRRHRITHINTEHFKCRSCDFSTSKWLSLKRHLALHSGEGSSSLSCLYEPKELPFKMYRCEQCGYCTAQSGNLKLHLRIHTGERPFKCGQCALTFRTSSHLNRHLLTHLRLHCRRCKYSTMDKCAFQKHIKTHKTKYTCGNCNVVLPTKRLLDKHKQQHKLGV